MLHWGQTTKCPSQSKTTWVGEDLGMVNSSRGKGKPHQDLEAMQMGATTEMMFRLSCQEWSDLKLFLNNKSMTIES